MPVPTRSCAEWEALIDRFLVSGLTQRAFCEQHELSFDAFRNRYQNSEKFAGKRRLPRGTAPSASSRGGGPSSEFRPVRSAPMMRGDVTAGSAPIVVRLHDSIAIEFAVGTDPAAVAALVRELAR